MKLTNLDSDQITLTTLAKPLMYRFWLSMTNFQNRYIFAIGGKNNKSEYFTSVDKYDLNNNSWTKTSSLQT